MSNDIVVSAKNIKKDFYLPHEKSSKSLKSAIINFGKKKDNEATTQHALKDISFEIKKGEFFGIVGRNGSGKSTLLKILAGIYQPTSGAVSTHGRVVPFIELGVGFNPELSGRENVFLNGALLGFTRKEISAIYDDIVEFAELERFMDQKLKNYSSGMQVRLAFSVAIKAEGDVLILDEVLAVGDESFQRKCNDYFRRIKNDATKTIILVTHSMESVKKYCDRAIMIKDGVLALDGSPSEVANLYTENNFESKEAKNKDTQDHKSGLSDRVPYFKVTARSKQVLSSDDKLIFDVEYDITDDTPVSILFSIVDEKRGGSILANGAKPIAKSGRNKLTYVFPLTYYNDTDIYVNAVLDEAKTRKRIAFTNENNSCRFAIRNNVSDNGLLRKDNDIHGHWVDWEEQNYNLKERN